MNLENLTVKVGNIAKHVGSYIQHEAQHFDFAMVETKGLNQLVSYVDKTAEEKLVEGLKKILPEAGFITEEQTIATEEKDMMWVIDPLDGTTNYIHQLPIYSISIGLIKKGKPILGVVYEPNRHELFYAWHKGGSFLNGRKIMVKQNNHLNKSLLATGFPYYDFELMPKYLNTLQQFLKQSQGMRRMGSAAVDLAYVSCGRFDGFFEYGLNPWDVAAGVLLVQEAGGKVTTFNGDDDAIFGRQIIAASQLIYPEFFSVIKQGFEL